MPSSTISINITISNGFAKGTISLVAVGTEKKGWEGGGGVGWGADPGGVGAGGGGYVRGSVLFIAHPRCVLVHPYIVLLYFFCVATMYFVIIIMNSLY